LGREQAGCGGRSESRRSRFFFALAFAFAATHVTRGRVLRAADVDNLSRATSARRCAADKNGPKTFAASTPAHQR